MTKKLPLEVKKNRPPPVSIACEFCHSKHLQCDVGRPCKNCIKRNIASFCKNKEKKIKKSKFVINYPKIVSNTEVSLRPTGQSFNNNGGKFIQTNSTNHPFIKKSSSANNNSHNRNDEKNIDFTFVSLSQKELKIQSNSNKLVTKGTPQNISTEPKLQYQLATLASTKDLDQAKSMLLTKSVSTPEKYILHHNNTNEIFPTRSSNLDRELYQLQDIISSQQFPENNNIIKEEVSTPLLPPESNESLLSEAQLKFNKPYLPMDTSTEHIINKRENNNQNTNNEGFNKFVLNNQNDASHPHDSISMSAYENDKSNNLDIIKTLSHQYNRTHVIDRNITNPATVSPFNSSLGLATQYLNYETHLSNENHLNLTKQSYGDYVNSLNENEKLVGDNRKSSGSHSYKYQSTEDYTGDSASTVTSSNYSCSEETVSGESRSTENRSAESHSAETTTDESQLTEGNTSKGSTNSNEGESSKEYSSSQSYNNEHSVDDSNEVSQVAEGPVMELDEVIQMNELQPWSFFFKKTD